MTDAKYDKATKVGIENALELLEEKLAVAIQTFHENEVAEQDIDIQYYIKGLQEAIEIVKLNITRS